MTFNRETIQRRSALFVFWAWHLIYTIVALFLVLPYLSYPLFNDALADNVPWHYLLFTVLIIILPFISMYLAVRYFQKDYRLLMKYFYGFEMSFLFFLLIRIFTFRDDGLAVQWLMLNVVLGLAAWLAFLFIQRRNLDNVTATNSTTSMGSVAAEDAAASNTVTVTSNATPMTKTASNGDFIPLLKDWRGTIGSTILAGIGLYFGSIFLIIQLPNAVEFFSAVGQELLRITWTDVTDLLLIVINPLWWLLGVFILFTFSLFLILPLAMIYLYVGQFIKRLANLKAPLQWALVLVVIAVNVVVLSSTTQQAQQQVFKTLEADQPMQQAQLIAQRDTIREGLLNAYLARYRYMSTTQLSQRIQHNYKNTFGLSDTAAAVPQAIFNTLLKPFLYQGEDWGDKQRAEIHYAEFFDAPIQKAERELILDTIKHTWEMTRDNEAGLLDTANHYVHLDEQSVDIIEADNVATITVQQTLRNLTYRSLETVLHFTLPEDAVLTGVWLSDNKRKLLKYPFVLAPKGAAQAVYKAEVNRRVDPALLEQTGPSQYRLRVYPVLGKARGGNKPGEPLYARFSYQTLADPQGNWPMPQVLEKRNLFWDSDTQYSLNGKALDHRETFNGFPQNVASTQADISQAGSNHADSSSADSNQAASSTLTFSVGEQQIQASTRQRDREPLPTTKRFAVLIDGSYSMRPHYADALKTLAKLKQKGIQFESYFCKQRCVSFSSQANDDPVFFGNSLTLEHLQAFSQIKQVAAYDAMLVLTDAGSYELESDAFDQALSLLKPLWLVHLGNTLPYAYNDKVLDTLYRSKGGIATSALEALRRYQLLENGVPTELAVKGAELISVSDQYLWFAGVGEGTSGRPSGIAAAHWLKHLIRTQDTKQLETLDQIHQVAKANNIVTHYSSMLVLVNDRQKEALKKAEENDDRFDRKVETGKQQTTNPSDPFAVPAVPEPEEWALIIIVLILLTYTLWRRKESAIRLSY